MHVMTKVHVQSTTSWLAVSLGFALGLLLDAHAAPGQPEAELLPTPRAFTPAQATHGSEYGGLDYNSQTFSPVRQRAGSVMPMQGDSLPQEGEVIYEGQPQFIGPADGEIMGTPGEGEIIYESEPGLGGVPGGHCESCGDEGCAGCGMADDCASCGTWGDCGRDDCDECIPLCLPRFRHLMLFGGVQGFKGPRDNGTGSNFGFHEGINITGRAPFLGNRGVAYQLGYRSTQSRLHGDLASQDGRVQHFVTGGLFRRSQVGLQYGIAYDLLRDDLVEEIDFSQLRAELSVLGPRGGEVGFLGMFHLSDDGITTGNGPVFFEPVDQYLLFFRRRFANCGEGRLWGGFSDEDDGIVGGEFLVPLDPCCSLAGGFNYLIPEEDAPPQGTIQEAWNVGISLVWQWNGNHGIQNSPFRPLFSVADNGLMIIDRP
jgi:hypothetical protein